MCDQKDPEQMAWPVKGQEVYDAEGAKYIYIGAVEGQHAVQSIVWDGEEETPGDIIVVDRIFREEPTAVYGPEIQSRRDRLSNLGREISEASQRLYKMIAAADDFKKAAGKYPNVTTALDFLEGRITCAIVDDYLEARIMPIEKVLEYIEENRREPGLKLLSLFGTTRGTEWAVNRYYDGSGDWKEILPFRTFEEAEAAFKVKVEQLAEAWRKAPENNKPNMERYKKTPYLPQDIRDAMAAQKAAARENNIKRLQAEIDRLIAERDTEASSGSPLPPLG